MVSFAWEGISADHGPDECRWFGDHDLSYARRGRPSLREVYVALCLVRACVSSPTRHPFNETASLWGVSGASSGHFRGFFRGACPSSDGSNYCPKRGGATLTPPLSQREQPDGRATPTFSRKEKRPQAGWAYSTGLSFLIVPWRGGGPSLFPSCLEKGEALLIVLDFREVVPPVNMDGPFETA